MRPLPSSLDQHPGHYPPKLVPLAGHGQGPSVREAISVPSPFKRARTTRAAAAYLLWLCCFLCLARAASPFRERERKKHLLSFYGLRKREGPPPTVLPHRCFLCLSILAKSRRRRFAAGHRLTCSGVSVLLNNLQELKLVLAPHRVHGS